MLVEQHRLTVQADGIPGDGNDRVTIARLHAEAWAHQHGMAIPAENFDVIAVGGELVGVAWETVVGRGDIDLDQREPGAKDNWTYSARAAWWRDVLEAVFARVRTTPKIRSRAEVFDQMQAEAKVIPMRRRDDPRWNDAPQIQTGVQIDYDGEPIPPFFGGPSAAD